MKKMQLSEALRLGSLLIANPRAGDIDRCGIAMALHAHGAVPDPTDALYPHNTEGSDNDCLDEETGSDSTLPVRPTEATSENWLHALRCHETLTQIYSWLDKSFPCPWCGEELLGTRLVYHPFDRHVMASGTGAVQISIEELSSWIASIEPPPECYGITLNLGLGVHFASEKEKNSVIRAAAASRMSASGYIAAAVRLVLENDLSIQDYELADPVIGGGQNVSYGWR